MQRFSSADCLTLWDSGAGLHPLDQGLLVLGAGFPNTPRDSLADWPIGRRNTALAQLRCSSFGPHLQGWTACPKCGEKLEIELDGRMLAEETKTATEPIIMNGQSFRPVTSRDLAKAARETEMSLAAVRLAESCCLDSGKSHNWSNEDLEQLGQSLALADPMSETRLALLCPACQNEWEENLDIVAFLWTEIEGRAKRLLLEIHTLASAYGWSERDILSLSERRRALYLEMAQS
ncbi:MAG TPA: hypothetical protein VH595_07405 [Verrucomicrobiae bacterium]|nr:hypothetical protein [Verrucomicrobiae bacterium]